jgi:hypothetical protein
MGITPCCLKRKIAAFTRSWKIKKIVNYILKVDDIYGVFIFMEENVIIRRIII